MKKLILIFAFLISIAGSAQVNRATVDTYWKNRVVPEPVTRAQTWASFYNLIDNPSLGTGSIVLSSNLTGYVPYTGATTGLDLGSQQFTTAAVTVNSGTSTPGVLINTDGTGNQYPLVVDGGSANSAAVFTGTNNSMIRIVNSGTTSSTWIISNQTIAGSQLNDFGIGNSPSPASWYFSLRNSTGEGMFRTKLYVGGIVTPTAVLHIGAGSASTAGIQLTTQTAYTTATAGSIYFTSPNFNFVGGVTSTSSVSASGYGLSGYTSTALKDQAGTGLISTNFIGNGGVALANNTTTQPLGFLQGGTSGTERARFAATTGNFLLNTTTDVSARLAVNGHIAGVSSTPTGTTGAGGGAASTATITGSDIAGNISVTTAGTPAGNDTVITITFASAYGSAPHIVLTPTGPNAAGLSGTTQVYVDRSSTTTTTFIIKSGAVGLTTGTVYSWAYTVFQ